MQFILIIIFISYYLTGFQITSLFGYGVTALDLALFLFFILIIKRLIWDGEEIKFSLTPMLILLPVLMLTVLLSSITPITEGQGTWILQFVKSFSHLIFLSAFTFFCAIMPIEIKNWTNIIKLFLILSFIINLFAIYQMIARAYDWPLAWINMTNVSLSRGKVEGNEMGYKQLSLSYGNFFRATSIFSEPSALGSFNAYIISFLLIPIVFRYKHFFKSKALLITLFILCAASSLFTFSLTALVSFLLVGAAFLFTQQPKNLFRFVIIIISVILVIIIADSLFSKSLGISIVELFSKRIEGIASYGTGQKEVFGESFSGRLKGAFLAIDIWKEYPLFGIGLGLTAYNKINALAFTDISFFGVLAELGIIGAITYLLFFFSSFFYSVRLVKSKDLMHGLTPSEQMMMKVPFFIMVVQFLVNFISGNNFISFNFWGYMAIVFSVINYAFIKKDIKTIRFRLVRTPLRILFSGMVKSVSKN